MNEVCRNSGVGAVSRYCTCGHRESSHKLGGCESCNSLRRQESPEYYQFQYSTTQAYKQALAAWERAGNWKHSFSLDTTVHKRRKLSPEETAELQEAVLE